MAPPWGHTWPETLAPRGTWRQNPAMRLRVSCTLLALSALLPAQGEVEFVRDVAPILQRRCLECHGQEEQEGDLRLDRREALFHEYKDEWVVVPGEPDTSELVYRITLPLDDPDIMPADGTRLSAAEVDTLKRWIAEGAAWPEEGDSWFVEASKAGVPQAILVPALSEEESAAEALAMKALVERGILVQRVAADTQALDVNMSLQRGEVGDEDVALLPDMAKTLVWLNLSHTAVTDRGLAALADLTELRRLHLAGTGITDAGLQHLRGLDRLEYLNLYGTRVSDAGLIHIAALPNLRKVFLWQTAVSGPAVTSLRRVRSGLYVDDGSYVEARLAAAEAEIAAREAAAQKPVNDVCPVSGKPVDTAFTVEQDGRLVAFCCGNCKAKFEADPSAFADKIVERGPSK